MGSIMVYKPTYIWGAPSCINQPKKPTVVVGHMKTFINYHWLVVTGTMEFYDFPYIGNNNRQLTNSYFSEGLVYHQPDWYGNIMAIFIIIPKSEEYYPR